VVAVHQIMQASAEVAMDAVDIPVVQHALYLTAWLPLPKPAIHEIVSPFIS
jgi:hypothetical protein